MKKNKIAFTMIELIVVTLIMVLLTSSSVFYFFNFIDNRSLLIETDMLNDYIGDLNKQVQTFKISDYDLHFSAGVNYYTGSINNLGTNYPVVFSVTNAGTGVFFPPDLKENDLWVYHIYENNRKLVTKTAIFDGVTPIQKHTFDFKKNYFIHGFVIDTSSYNTIPTNTVLVHQLTTRNSGIDLVAPRYSIFSNKNNIITPVDLEFEKGQNTFLLQTK